jgi:hypothetical protein
MPARHLPVRQNRRALGQDCKRGRAFAGMAKSAQDWVQPVRFCGPMTAAAGTCHSSF